MRECPFCADDKLEVIEVAHEPREFVVPVRNAVQLARATTPSSSRRSRRGISASAVCSSRSNPTTAENCP
jgi:hypothetical protein